MRAGIYNVYLTIYQDYKQKRSRGQRRDMKYTLLAQTNVETYNAPWINATVQTPVQSMVPGSSNAMGYS